MNEQQPEFLIGVHARTVAHRLCLIGRNLANLHENVRQARGASIERGVNELTFAEKERGRFTFAVFASHRKRARLTRKVYEIEQLMEIEIAEIAFKRHTRAGYSKNYTVWVKYKSTVLV